MTSNTQQRTQYTKYKQPTTGWKRFVSIDKKNDVRITTEKLEKRVYWMNLTHYDKATLPYKIELTYLQKNNLEKQRSCSKNCFNKFLNYGVTWSWHHWLKHIFNVNCGYTSLFLDVYPFLRISVKLQIFLKNQCHFWISRWKLRLRGHRGNSMSKKQKDFLLIVFLHIRLFYFVRQRWCASQTWIKIERDRIISL